MPVTINEVESQIEVESASAQTVSSHEDDAIQAMQRWQELARAQMRREARTAAWGFDD
jgi:hypothetical protein